MTTTQLLLSDREALQKHAIKLKQHVLTMTNKAKSSHVGSAFSVAELMTVLYNGILNITPETVDDPNRDRFIMSKGHAVSVLYATLAERGFFPMEWLETFYQDDTILAGHATHKGIPGIEVATGSLGHGLPIGCGMAYAAKQDKRDYRTFVMLSDGECDEGSNWEAIMFAGHHKLDNLVAIVDYNKVQSIGTVEEVMNLEPFAAKWEAFGWNVREIDGHNIEEAISTFQDIPFEKGKPNVVIAHTIKGKGVSFMEGTVLWHYRSPQGEELEAARKELESQL
jgi:transketolase